MKIQDIAFGTTDWEAVPRTEHRGERGITIWRTREFGDMRARMIEYSPDYLADLWCSKGHIVLVLEGELITELPDGRRSVLKAGQSYQVADGAESHRSTTVTGAKLFIVD